MSSLCVDCHLVCRSAQHRDDTSLFCAVATLRPGESDSAPISSVRRTATSIMSSVCVCPAGMMEGPQGFDLSSGLWEARGWRQIDALRRKLERLKELRELVRTLGRAGGRGPRRRAPEEVRFKSRLTPHAGLCSERMSTLGCKLLIHGSTYPLQSRCFTRLSVPKPDLDCDP